MRHQINADDRLDESRFRACRIPTPLRQAAAEILYLEAVAGNRATNKAMGGVSVQQTPSKLRTQFTSNPLVNRSLLDRVRRPGWNVYLLKLEQYWRVPDDDIHRRIATFPDTYRAAKSLESAFGHEFGNGERALVELVNSALELERYELSGPASARLTPDRAFFLGAEEDPQIKDDHRHTVLDDAAEIFAREPCMEDVVQGNLGDCYLLAAVTSIVRINPKHLKSHIIDNLNGTITVNFYQKPGVPFPTTVLKSTANGEYARGSVWIQLLEKAYVASGLQLNPLSRTRQSEGATSGYTQIAGGRAEQALMHLTGHQVTSIGMGKTRKQFRNTAGEQSNSNPVVKMLREKIEQSADRLTTSSSADTAAAMEQLSRLQAAIMNLMNLVAMVYLSQQDVEDFVAQHKSIPGFDDFMTALGPIRLLDLPGPLGSGKYGKEELDAFTVIRDAIEAGRPVVINSKSTISDPENKEERGKGRSGEVKVAGLAAGHAYSVLDYKPRGPLVKDTQTYVLLRNPWGEYGRKYTADGLRGLAEEKGNGQFWLDLGDLVAYFDDISTTARTGASMK